MNTPLIIAGLSLLGSLSAGYMAYRASTQANKISDKKVDADAYERARTFYEKLLSDADRQLDRLRTQTDRMQDELSSMNTKLLTEQENSSSLKDHVRNLQRQVLGLEQTVETLNLQLQRHNKPQGNTPSN